MDLRLYDLQNLLVYKSQPPSHRDLFFIIQPMQEKYRVKNSLVLKNVVLSLLPVLVSSNDFLFLQNCFYRD